MPETYKQPKESKDRTGLITIAEFEQQVKRVEGIILHVRDAEFNLIPGYQFSRQAAGNTNVKHFRETRLKSNGRDKWQFVITDGHYHRYEKGAEGRHITMRWVRESYNPT